MSDPATWEHVATQILLLDSEEIALLKAKRIRKMSFFNSMETVDRLGVILPEKDGLFYELEDFCRYIIGHKPSNADLMSMTETEYREIPRSAIKLAYELAVAPTSTSASNAPPRTQNQPPSNTNAGASVTQPFGRINISMDCSRITPAFIKTVDFQRYTNFNLNATDDILKFYSDVQSQGSQYNVLLRHIDEITPTATLYPSDLPPESIVLISSTLINKFRQDKVVSPNYEIGQNLLKTTTDGFTFLKQLLMISHPKFTDIAVGLEPIPVYSKYKDLYLYARAVQEYVGVQRIEGRNYSTKEISQLFLKYLDEKLYQKAVMVLRNRLEAHTDNQVPMSLQVPGLATTICQQMIQLGEETDTKNYDTITKLSSLTESVSSITDTEPISYSNVFSFVDSKTNQYTGVCKACGRPNHHEKDCNFLTKVKQCLAYMKMDRSAGNRKANFYKKKGTYKDRRDKVKLLQEANMIPLIFDADIFLDVPESDDDIILCSEVQEE